MSGNRLDVNLLNISIKGKEFIKEWEGFKADVYDDSNGYCSIGYGHLIARDACAEIEVPIEFRDGITRNKADELFENRLPSYVDGLKNSVTTRLYQHEFDSLVCLLFNIGGDGLNTKAPRLKEKLNQGDYEGAAVEFMDITNGGQSGLVNRRDSERNLFLNNIYDALTNRLGTVFTWK